MFHLSSRAVLAAAASVAALLAAGPVSAQTGLFGGGSTLAASTYSQVFQALDSTTPGIYCGNSTSSNTFAPAGTADTVCNNYGYIGSGKGAAALFANSASVEYGTYPNPKGTPNYFNVVAYAASDSALSSGQVGIWNNGGTQSSVTVTAQQPTAGALLQVPTFGTPITVAYKFNGAVGFLGGIQLTDAQLCGIFSGSITTTNDTHLTGIAGDPNFPNAYSGKTVPANPITVVYRGDSSGTTYLFHQHLAAVCPSYPVTNPKAAFATALPTGTLPTQTFSTLFSGGVPSNFSAQTGSAGVENKINSTPFSIGYLSPDYTKISARNANGAFPVVAKLKNLTDGNFYLPDLNSTSTALNSATITNLKDPTTYSPPVATPAAGYPIVGFTNLFFPQCFSDNNVANELYNLIQAVLPGGGYTLQINQGGFVPLPQSLANAINDNVLNNNNGNNLDLQDGAFCQAAGAAGPGTFTGR